MFCGPGDGHDVDGPDRAPVVGAPSQEPDMTRLSLCALIATAVLAAAITGLSGCYGAGGNGPAAPARPGAPAAGPLRVVVMDPLAARLACECVGGYAQRPYERLGAFLADRLGREVTLAFAESLTSRAAGVGEGVDLVIGKFSVVRFDARKLSLPVTPIAMLTGKEGTVTQTGLFVVRTNDKAKSLVDLKGRKVLFGPVEADEKHSAAVATLDAFGLPVTGEPAIRPGCGATALAVVEKEADAGVISSYALPLLEGCGNIDKGTLRVIDQTDPVPFVAVFATDRLDAAARKSVLGALLALREDAPLLKAMESKDGFVEVGPKATGWADWRGPGRRARSPYVPERLPAKPRLLWSRMLSGPGVSGASVRDGRVIVADKGNGETADVWRCLDADTGRELWNISYNAPARMDYTNTPRANPVIHNGRAYLLGAFGHLHCVRVGDGKVLWKRHMIADFGAELPTWGFCGTPLVVDEMLIVAPGAETASLVALDLATGKVIWRAEGDPPGYGSLVPARLGGVRQIVGHDAASLGGWDPATGKRLWTLVPPESDDFNVPTPIVVGDKLLVATENNGTRLYGFDTAGRIVPKPVAKSDDLVPDTSTPVVVDGLVFGSCEELVCLDLRAGLTTLWRTDKAPFDTYCSFIAGDGRVMVMTHEGRLCLLKTDRSGKMDLVSSVHLFPKVHETERAVWSHPALVDGRLYVRNVLGIYCFLLE